MNWFGKGCEYLIAQWEDDEIVGGPDYQECEPVLVFCKHPNNPQDVEGNCNPTICPLGKKKIRRNKMIKQNSNKDSRPKIPKTYEGGK